MHGLIRVKNESDVTGNHHLSLSSQSSANSTETFVNWDLTSKLSIILLLKSVFLTLSTNYTEFLMCKQDIFLIKGERL